MLDLKKYINYLFWSTLAIAFSVTLIINKFIVLNTDKKTFSFPVYIHLALLLLSYVFPFILPSKNRKKGRFLSTLSPDQFLTRTLFFNLPLALIFIYILFAYHTGPSLFSVIHLSLFNLAYTIFVVLYINYIKNLSSFVDSFNDKLELFSSTNTSPIERSDFIIQTLNDEMVHLNDAYAIMRETTYTQLLDQNLDKYYEYQNVINTKFINEDFSGRLAFETDQLLLKYFQQIDNPEYHKTVEIEEWMKNNYYDTATLIIRYYEKEPDERIKFKQKLEKDILILEDKESKHYLRKIILFTEKIF